MIDSINTVCKEVALNLGMEDKLVHKIYAHYWKQGLKASVASGKYTSIWIRGIGTLAMSRTKVNKRIVKLIHTLRWLEVNESTNIRKTKAQIQQEALDELRLMCARRNEIAITYNKNLQKVQERYDAKHKGHLEQQTFDNDGGGESSLSS